LTIKAFGKVAVLMGGTSNERNISLESGKAVLKALHRSSIDASAIDPKIDGLEKLKNFDRAFICLHGQDGEDGKIQTFLESINIPYTGSGILSSSLGMDKFKCKKIWKSKKIQTPDFMKIDDSNQFEKASNLCGLPFFIKPANSGSSIGIAKVSNKKEFIPAFENAYEIDKTVIAESFIIGREYTLPIIKNKPLPIIEIRVKTDFYDFEAKYLRDDTEFICPADISSILVENINTECTQSFNAIGCDGWGRVDFIVDQKNIIHIIEINTVPGLTNHSLVPMSARNIGIEFDQLVVMILETSNV
jgi:D-alanine-D-alanine ligase|tara:strand:- start:1629 stop:2537 length:909 start_codon:yes stop_codon:yes gene_type:complete